MRKRKSRGDCARARLNEFAEKTPDRQSHHVLFQRFGKLEGVISDTASGAFLLELEMTRSMREKVASKLTWLEKKLKDLRVSDVRKKCAHHSGKSALNADPGRRHDS
jgi:hypothetical protein